MEISPAELILLVIIENNSEISGYDINRFIEENRYRAWADIGMTSIYTGLGKLKKKELVFAYLVTRKSGKGPSPYKYRITVKGRSILKEGVKSALSRGKVQDKAFSLGLAGLSHLTNEEAKESLQKRIARLVKGIQKVQSEHPAHKKDKNSMSFQSPAEHIRFLLEKEVEFTKNLIMSIKKEKS